MGRTALATKPVLKTKYALVGEMVRVVARRQFIRCGYPLCGGDIRTTAPYKEKFDKLQQALVNAAHKVCQEVLGDSNWLTGMADQSIHMQSDKLAVSILLNEAGFGGNERKVYEEDIDPHVRIDGEWRVVSRKIVYSGKRVSGGASGYYGEDYDPPYLGNAQAHCVYKLEQTGREPNPWHIAKLTVLDESIQRKCGEEWV